MQDPDQSKVDIIAFANANVLNSAGEQIKIGHLWAKQSIIFVFLRHFACIACRAHATQVWDDRERYQKTGAKLIFIGNGAPSYIEQFRAELNLDPAVVLTDPSLLTFKAAGFRNGFFRVVHPHSVANALKLAARGQIQAPYTQEAGTHWQLGGIVAVSSHGKVLYHFISHVLGDFPTEGDVEELVVSTKRPEEPES